MLGNPTTWLSSHEDQNRRLLENRAGQLTCPASASTTSAFRTPSLAPLSVAAGEGVTAEAVAAGEQVVAEGGAAAGSAEEKDGVVAVAAEAAASAGAEMAAAATATAGGKDVGAAPAPPAKAT